ncbi:MAG TPA: polysaccharide deacetylase family protein [Candidatus Baltobacteraceae bacterium]|nr:polysaccharide deacetylase family protein [Candidatus Baltobacteraceae bacterium]
MRRRASYVSAPARPRLRLPDGARMALHVIVNVETWLLEERLPRQVLTAPGGVQPLPDVPNFAWYEYGMRVGIWRVLDVLREHGVRATLSVNASVCDAYPDIVRAAVDAGWEMMAHGYHQKAMPAVDDERDVVRRAVERLAEATGKRPRGWLGPGLVETWETPEILVAEGIDYCCDWGPADDLPYELDVANGALLAVPYPIEMNDIVIYGLEKRPDDTLLERGRRYFERLYRESETQAKIMPVALHPWIAGAPHRIDYLDALLRFARGHDGVRFMRGGEIADWYRAATAAPSVSA